MRSSAQTLHVDELKNGIRAHFGPTVKNGTMTISATGVGYELASPRELRSHRYEAPQMLEKSLP